MYAQVCTCVCMMGRVRKGIHVYARVCACVEVMGCVCIYACMCGSDGACAHRYTRVYVCMCGSDGVCAQVYTFVRTCAHVWE